MDIRLNIFLNFLCFVLVNSFVIKDSNDNYQISEEVFSDVPEIKKVESDNPANVFNGVYTECFFHLSYTCLQKKTLLYLKELNRLNEISVIGDYVKFVKLNTTENFNEVDGEEHSLSVAQSSEELAYMIDKAVDKFFDNHLIRFSALGKDVLVPDKVEEEFVGRKKRKGGGGGGGHGGGDGDGGKKKMMMMAMMCMKMKLMMMIPAMMGMMGMMSFKGMMFSMMSFMISKMMLLMKILEKKGGGAGGGGGGDGGWAAGGGGGGAWMPTGQDYGGGGGGGYDANGQWQSRSIIEDGKDIHQEELPMMLYSKPIVRYSNPTKTLSLLKNVNSQVTKQYNNNHDIKPKTRKKREIIKDMHNEKEEPELSNVETKTKYNTFVKLLSLVNNANMVSKQYNNNYEHNSYLENKRELKDIDNEKELAIGRHNNFIKPVSSIKNVKDQVIEQYKNKHKIDPKSRKKRGIIDVLQNAYLYWANKVLGIGNKRPTNNYPKYKIVNGIKYVYYPIRTVKVKAPKELPIQTAVKENEVKSVIMDDFNKGEIIEGPIESRMIRKRFKKAKDNMNETVDMVEDNPWQ